MRVDKQKLDSLLALSDAELWAEVCKIAEGHGLKLPKDPPAKDEMAKLRGAVSHGASINLAKAMRVINDHSRGHENG